MQNIILTLVELAETPTGATTLGFGGLIVGPPVTKRIYGLTTAFWGPKVTKLRKVIAEGVAPKEPSSPAEDPVDVVELRERV